MGLCRDWYIDQHSQGPVDVDNSLSELQSHTLKQVTGDNLMGGELPFSHGIFKFSFTNYHHPHNHHFPVPLLLYPVAPTMCG